MTNEEKEELRKKALFLTMFSEGRKNEVQESRKVSKGFVESHKGNNRTDVRYYQRR